MKQLTLSSNADANATASSRDADTRILAELEKIRNDNKDGHMETQQALTRLEASFKILREDMTKLENRTTEIEERISDNEDSTRRHERALRYLLHREMDLTARCEDMQNRLRRNNLRIYRVPEGSEGRDVKLFVLELCKSTLQLPADLNIGIERAHRALAAKPKNPDAAPRSLVVRFWDFSVKETILRQAWDQKRVLYKGTQIYFDHDSGTRCGKAIKAEKHQSQVCVSSKTETVQGWW